MSFDHVMIAQWGIVHAEPTDQFRFAMLHLMQAKLVTLDAGTVKHYTR